MDDIGAEPLNMLRIFQLDYILRLLLLLLLSRDMSHLRVLHRIVPLAVMPDEVVFLSRHARVRQSVSSRAFRRLPHASDAFRRVTTQAPLVVLSVRVLPTKIAVLLVVAGAPACI